MKDIRFEYNGREHSGKIISSTNIEPHYHWFYFTDTEIKTIIKDDCIGFKKTDRGLRPTRIYTTHTELVEQVRSIVEKHI
jgi:hypothetical protein